MSYISDFKGAPFSLFGSKGSVNPTVASDASPTTLCGAKFSTADGRELVLVKNSTSALVAGNLIQAPASIGANHTGLAVVGLAPANPIGATSITVTLGGSAATENQYQGGYAVVSAGTGLGQTLRIASHPAQTVTSGNLVLTLEDPLSVALTSADSKVSLTLNPYTNVIISPTTATGKSVGVTLTPIPASSYGFLVTRGLTACLNIANTAIGLDVMAGSGTAGSVITYVVATRNRVGTATVAGENAKCQMIDVQL
jgi:hypothetical protein